MPMQSAVATPACAKCALRQPANGGREADEGPQGRNAGLR